MTNPIRLNSLAVTPSLSRPSAAGGSNFASRLGGGAGPAVASGIQSLGRQVLNAATGGMPPVVQNLAQGAAQAAGGAPGGPDAAFLDIVDKTRFYVMMQSIFAAANMPTVEKQ